MFSLTIELCMIQGENLFKILKMQFNKGKKFNCKIFPKGE